MCSPCPRSILFTMCPVRTISWPGVVPTGVSYDGMMCTLDFYATAAAAAGQPLPERCDGKNLLPYLKGTKEGDVHQYLFWHNADPSDAPRRNLYAVRWKNWRLVKYPDGWRLFDLKADPEETKDVAKTHSDTIDHMIDRYSAFVATLPPLKPSADYKGGGEVPKGWGWSISHTK